MGTAIKTEHAGAKNGGGFYGHRDEAKEVSNRLRREEAKVEARKAIAEYQPRHVVATFVDQYGDQQIIHRPAGGAASSLRVFRALNTPALRLNRAVAYLLGDRIKSRRLELGLSLKEVAYRAGMQTVSPKQYIHAIETAGKGAKASEGIRLGTLFALSYALECAPSDLLPPMAEAMTLANISPEEFAALAA